MTTMKRTLAKGLLPALLLSAALSIPAASVAAPSLNGKAHAADKANRNKQQKVQKVKVERQARQAQQHAQQARKQAAKATQHARKAQRQAVKARPIVVRQAAPRRVVVRQAAPRRVVGQQRVVVVPQRVVAPRNRVVVAQPRYVAPGGRRYAWDGWNRRYSRYATTGTFQLEGTFVDRQYGCALIQDRSGQVIPLVGFDPMVPRRGEQFLLTGRVENGTSCGTAFRVFSVDRVWADASHRTVLFDRRYDGDYFGSYRDRYDNRSGRYDNGYYDDRYDRSGNRQLISLDGRLDDSGRCPAIRGDNGEYYDLVGDLRGFQDGDHARVIGFLGSRSRCGGPAIDVQEID
ncbi:MAG TPA: hypothetical protein VGX68_16620 [Thermoanaerobaculia bacterium]|jgi:hypothetical protein|nr:hypothetical protein [Thermoanaerobaculia bacterium]